MSAVERGPNKQCDYCGGVTRFAQGAVRCIDEACPNFWLNQGGIEALTPNPPTPAPPLDSLPIIIRNPSQG